MIQPPDLRPLIPGVKGVQDWALRLLALAVSTIELLKTSASPDIEVIRQNVNTLNPTGIISPPEAASAAARSLRAYPVLEELARRNGINADQFRLMVDSDLTNGALGDLITAAYRGDISPDELQAAFTRSGLTDLGIIAAKSAGAFYPGPADLIRMMVRDVFTPAVAEKFGQYEQYPDMATALGEKAGLSPQIMRWYWAAHWELPSTTQGFEMLQREVISPEELDFLLRAADVLPFWREKLLKISYNPIGRIDIRRFHALGTVTTAQLPQLFRAQGYSPENADLASAWVVTYNANAKKAVDKDRTAQQTTAIVSARTAGTISQGDAVTQLTALGVSARMQTQLFAESNLKQQTARHNRIATSVRPYYVDSIWTAAETATALTGYGFGAEEQAALFEDWKIDRGLKDSRAKMSADRDLTKAEIIGAFRAAVITEADTRELLKTLRYDPKEIDVLVKTAQLAERKAVLADELEAVHRRMVARKISEQDATLALDALGVRRAQRDALILKWSTEIKSVTVDLTIGQLTELLKIGAWDAKKVAAYLPRYGYDDDEQAALLILMGDKASLAAAQKADRAAKAALKAGTGVPPR